MISIFKTIFIYIKKTTKGAEQFFEYMFLMISIIFIKEVKKQPALDSLQVIKTNKGVKIVFL